MKWPQGEIKWVCLWSVYSSDSTFDETLFYFMRSRLSKAKRHYEFALTSLEAQMLSHISCHESYLGVDWHNQESQSQTLHTDDGLLIIFFNCFFSLSHIWSLIAKHFEISNCFIIIDEIAMQLVMHAMCIVWVWV